MLHAFAPPRSFQESPSHVSLPTSPGRGTVRNRQTSLPVRTSNARMSPGAAIPGEHLTRLFDRFYRADPSRAYSHDSHGLGLAIVKAIACEAVAQTGLPLSRLSLADLTTRAHYALGKAISRSTVALRASTRTGIGSSRTCCITPPTTRPRSRGAAPSGGTSSAARRGATRRASR